MSNTEKLSTASEEKGLLPSSHFRERVFWVVAIGIILSVTPNKIASACEGVLCKEPPLRITIRPIKTPAASWRRIDPTERLDHSNKTTEGYLPYPTPPLSSHSPVTISPGSLPYRKIITSTGATISGNFIHRETPTPGGGLIQETIGENIIIQGGSGALNTWP